jgi:hypothetical protein
MRNRKIRRSEGGGCKPLHPSGLLIFLFLISSSRTASAAGAVDVVAQDAAQALGQTPASSVVVAAPLVSDQPAPRAEDLALRIAALVAGKLGAGARVHGQTTQLATARAIAGRATALVYVQTELSKGDLRTTIDVYPSMANAWDRIRNPLPAPTGHAFASAKIDGEVRTFLAPLVLEQASIHRARHDEGDVLAAACGDADGDGGVELVLVSRARVAMGRVRGGKFVAERTAPWSALAPRAPVPMREPLAGAVVAQGTVNVGSTDRGSLALTPDFVGHRPILGVPAWGGDGVVCLGPEPSAGAFDGAPFDCAVSRDVKPKMAVPAPRFDAFGAASVVDPGGGARPVVAVREPSGKLKLRMGESLGAPDGTYGAQIAVVDLDQDGAPEIATSVDGPDDAVNVWSWAGTGNELRGRIHLAAPGGVRALAVCPPEDNGQPSLVAVVGAEVWLVRAGARGAAATKGEAATPKQAER